MNWIKVWKSSIETESWEVKNLLESHAIPVQLLNQKDTMYIFLGEISIMVPDIFEEDARKVLTINGYLADYRALN